MTQGYLPSPEPRRPAMSEPPSEDTTFTGLLPTSLVVTIRGERPADELEAGEIVIVLARAGYSPVQRVTETIVDLARRPEAAPVLVTEGALDRFSPSRTTVLAPQSLLGLDDWLIPAEALVNGRSIRRLPASGLVRYVQLEMGQHDMIVADGVRVASLRRGEEPCRPLLGPGPTLDALRERILRRIPSLEAAGLLPPAEHG
ncbi:hypothetical protein GXW74_22280 [Roseomonas eburnea]|uniref:Hedgehog/Intein (Hint) domain-containing protein n=1 Tax=Neoroseomonas eburnea TaxID=1346889 RepID=A0A9X9XHP5_9PROT|nr:Hint domain-containing protein [Neoroseomonas eburnea]MBR0683231.1 hypothetical protein [Neoroseomonas eburnea]